MGIGAQLVDKSIELDIQWMKLHKWLYSRGEEIISDYLYDRNYQHYELDLGYVGNPETRPETPTHAKLKEEAEAFDLPLWDHMKEFRLLTETQK